MGRIRKIPAIPILNTMTADMVEALGFRWAASCAKDGWRDDVVLEGDAQGIVQMVKGAQVAKSSIAVIITDTL